MHTLVHGAPSLVLIFSLQTLRRVNLLRGKIGQQSSTKLHKVGARERSDRRDASCVVFSHTTIGSESRTSTLGVGCHPNRSAWSLLIRLSVTEQMSEIRRSIMSSDKLSRTTTLRISVFSSLGGSG